MPINTTSSKMIKQQHKSQINQKKKLPSIMKTASILVCTIALIASLFPARPVEAGRLQDFIQNLVGGRDNSNSNSNSNNNNNNGNSNSNSNSNSDSNSDSDTAATSDQNDQQLTPMMSAMNPFMRYPSFYDSFSPASYGAYPMSFSNPMGAMSGLSPMAAMSSNSLGGTFSPASFGPASFGAGSFGSHSASSMGSPFGTTGGMSASSLSNIYANSPSLMGGYGPLSSAYYAGKR